MDSSCSAVLGFLCRNFPFMMHQMSSAGKGSRLFHYKATLLQQMQYCLTEICKPVPEKDLQLPFCTDRGLQKHQCKPLMQAFQLRIVPVLNAPESLKIRHPIVMFSLVICPRDLSTFSSIFWWYYVLQIMRYFNFSQFLHWRALFCFSKMCRCVCFFADWWTSPHLYFWEAPPLGFGLVRFANHCILLFIYKHISPTFLLLEL